MALFMLCREKVGPPICWDDVNERRLLRSDIVQQIVDKIQLIGSNSIQLKVNKKAILIIGEENFQVRDHVFLEVSPIKGIMRFGVQGKVSPKYVGSFEILEKFGVLAYHLALGLHIRHARALGIFQHWNPLCIYGPCPRARRWEGLQGDAESDTRELARGAPLRARPGERAGRGGRRVD